MKSPNMTEAEQFLRLANLVSEDYRLSDAAFRTDILNFAMELMAHYKVRIFEIAERLQRENYRFAEPDRVLVDPEASVGDWIAEFRQKNLHVPICLEAWLKVIGEVNLMGTHPDWPIPGYAFDDEQGFYRDWIYHGETDAQAIPMQPGREYPIYSDPLVVEMAEEYARNLYDEWLYWIEHDDEVAPFRLHIAPDHIHKANISGGIPIQLGTDRPAIDRLLLNERHMTSFVAYIRIALRWHGFPGFDFVRDQIPKGWEPDDICF